MPDFCHLHCHTQFSLLDGAANIDAMLAKAKADDMKAVAITDHGNMFGAFHFFNSAKKHGLTPIIGCEFYVVKDRFEKKFDKIQKDRRYHQLLLSKNEEGYKNLTKLCSLGFIEGFYKYPRVDKDLIRQYKEGLIATTCCVAAEVPRTFLEKGEEEAEKVFLEWLDIFGEDYYVELQRHGLKNINQDAANDFLVKMARRHNVKMIATNDSHYVDQEDFNAHDILLCINTGDFQSTQKGDGKGFRFGFENDQFYFKTKAEMAALFKDIPEAVENTMEIVDKITPPELKRDILLPNYTLPQGFKTQDEYLRHLTFEKAKHKYGELTAEIRERLDFELKVISDMGFAGYFLIVQDFIDAARKRGVAVGPGRGSAAGSAVAYVIGITNIDPIKYNLLFERFLNPERVSMPDIDIDFDDEGRQRVIDYVVETYGKNQVAQIITYGTMAAKSSIRDVGRVMQYPLSETDKLAKMVPDGPGVTLKKAFKENSDLNKVRTAEDTEPGKVLKLAETLEGSVRHRGIHAAGVIIAPDDLTNYIPVCTSKDSELLVTQFDGKVIEEAGMLKMDFLGLKTLSIINDAVKLVERNHKIKIEPDNIPLDDEKTFELYKKGDTIGTFQFESEGMRSHLKELKPTHIEDLIAMNALYRPGPMDYIPNFIKRKQGAEKVEYPHELLEEILKPTHGIMVYQEQIMQTAQIIGGFSLGKADILRRAMGKKKMDVMEGMKEEFINGAKEKNIDRKKAEEIFGTMMKFAEYGFNRSHSAAYSMLAFQTAYLKANYPAEYMAAVLTHNMNDIKKVNFFLDECKKMRLKVLGPSINESREKFSVNEKGEIRYALSAIKGVGGAAVADLVKEREENGPYTSLFDLAKRVNLRAVNKKSIESLIIAGAFDEFKLHRSQYFYANGDETNAMEKAIKYGNNHKNNMASSQNSLFGEAVMVQVEEPPIPECEPWPLIELLQKEKETIGIYLTGHPLDDFKLEARRLTTCEIMDIEQYKNKDVSIAGIVISATERIDKRGNKFGLFTIEDYSGTLDMALFKEDYLQWRNLLSPGELLFIKGTYQLRWRSEDRYELKIRNIDLLSQAGEKYINKLKLKIDINDINDKLLNDLSEICEKNPGKLELNFLLFDPVEKYSVELFSKKARISLNENVQSFLETLPEKSFQVN